MFYDLSTGAGSPVLQGLHQASSHLQQLQAHLLRTSPYLSPQNSFIQAAAVLHSSSSPYLPLFGVQPKDEQAKEDLSSSNVVSSTMEEAEEAAKAKKKAVKKQRANKFSNVILSVFVFKNVKLFLIFIICHQFSNSRVNSKKPQPAPAPVTSTRTTSRRSRNFTRPTVTG